ncbi:MAG: cupin domain-containing protein [Phycisphaerae bacterium]|nr:cupin domain-containing protein [Phycisphaerae bacterium]
MSEPIDARVLAWSNLPTDRPMPRITRQRVMGEHMMISRVKLSKGFFVPTHHHFNEQMVCVIAGRASFVLHEGTPKERAVTLGAGEVLHLPPDVPHNCTALEDTEIWDLFSPPSARTGVDRG